MFYKSKSHDTITLEEKSSNTGEEETKLEAKLYHQWGNKHGRLVCLVCDKSGDGIVDLDQNCHGNLFETIVPETKLQQPEELQLAAQEA